MRLLRKPSRAAAVNTAQAGGLLIVALSVGAIYWQAGGILLGLSLAAIGYLHDGGDT